MRNRHPFAWLPASGQKRVFIVLLALTLTVMVGLNILGRPLNTEVAPLGIISFELAGGLSQAQRMVRSWGPTGQVYAGLNLGLDYVFMIAYAGCISLGCVLVVRTISRRAEFLSAAGVSLAWAQLGAALLDAVENYALIQVLLGSQQALWPIVARWCAIPKFTIVAAGLVYISLGAVLAVAKKGRG